MRIVLLSSTLVLSACATAPAPAPLEAPRIVPPGMEKVMGKPAEAALGMLGSPSLDRREGPARQLQFAGACVLDLFYYPDAGARAGAVARHADARLPNGQALGADSCFKALVAARARG